MTVADVRTRTEWGFNEGIGQSASMIFRSPGNRNRAFITVMLCLYVKRLKDMVTIKPYASWWRRSVIDADPAAV